MSRFIEILGLVTGRKVEVQRTGLFWKLVDRGPIKFIKAKRRKYLTTNDLDLDRKLNVDYIKNRERRKRGEID